MQKRTLLASVALAALLAACGKTEPTASTAPAAAPAPAPVADNWTRWVCDSQTEVLWRFTDAKQDAVDVRLGGGDLAGQGVRQRRAGHEIGRGQQRFLAGVRQQGQQAVHEPVLAALQTGSPLHLLRDVLQGDQDPPPIRLMARQDTDADTHIKPPTVQGVIHSLIGELQPPIQPRQRQSEIANRQLVAGKINMAQQIDRAAIQRNDQLHRPL